MMFDKEYLAELKRIRTERVTSDQIVAQGPALVFSLVIASTGQAEADADVYDGLTVGGRPKFDLYCVDEAMAQLVFPTPCYFSEGIFVDLGTNCESVTVQYMPLLGRRDDLH